MDYYENKVLFLIFLNFSEIAFTYEGLLCISIIFVFFSLLISINFSKYFLLLLEKIFY